MPPPRSALALLGLAVALHAAPSFARDLRLAEGATVEAFALAVAKAFPKAFACVRGEGREVASGARVFVGKALLPGRLACDAKVVGPRLAGRTRASRTLYTSSASGTLTALDRYGEPEDFYARASVRGGALDDAAATLWEALAQPTSVLVPPGVIMAPPGAGDPACQALEPFSSEEIVATLQGARADAQYCWAKNAGRSAFTFDVVTDQKGRVLPRLVAALRSEPKVVNCLMSALAKLTFDAERARCHQVATQWPITAGR